MAIIGIRGSSGRVVLHLEHDGHAALQYQDDVAAVWLFRQEHLTPVNVGERLEQGVLNPVLALLPSDHGRLRPLLVDGADDLVQFGVDGSEGRLSYLGFFLGVVSMMFFTDIK